MLRIFNYLDPEGCGKIIKKVKKKWEIQAFQELISGIEILTKKGVEIALPPVEALEENLYSPELREKEYINYEEFLNLMFQLIDDD